jgi:MFS family permease
VGSKDHLDRWHLNHGTSKPRFVPLRGQQLITLRSSATLSSAPWPTHILQRLISIELLQLRKLSSSMSLKWLVLSLFSPYSDRSHSHCPRQAYSGALGPCAWIYASEIFPTHIRDKGVNISQAGQQITTLWINQAWPVMFGNVGHNAYWILVGINLIGLIVVLLFWPETKGISLEHMDRIFGEEEERRASMVSDRPSVLAGYEKLDASRWVEDSARV